METIIGYLDPRRLTLLAKTVKIIVDTIDLTDTLNLGYDPTERDVLYIDEIARAINEHADDEDDDYESFIIRLANNANILKDARVRNKALIQGRQALELLESKALHDAMQMVEQYDLGVPIIDGGIPNHTVVGDIGVLYTGDRWAVVLFRQGHGSYSIDELVFEEKRIHLTTKGVAVMHDGSGSTIEQLVRYRHARPHYPAYIIV